jgi:transcriptional regulator with XRE-family HTH domain
VLQVHNLATVTEPSDGERVALRRNRLGWKQRTLAEAAKVSLTTVVQIEKDRGVRTDSLRAVLAALDAAEKKGRERPITSPPTGTTEPSMKEGADDAHASSKRAHDTLTKAEVFLVEALEAVRRARADLAQTDSSDQRKRG